MTNERRYLIVNADDFGHSDGVNTGVIKAHEQGILTSASLMVRWPAAEEAAAYGRDNPDLSIGLHIDLGESVLRDGEWISLYEVVPTDDAEAVDAEVRRQIASFRALMGADPTHLDSHQHAHFWDPPAAAALHRVAHQLGAPLRHSSDVRYCGAFYGQTMSGQSVSSAITVENLIDILKGLETGITELACHPGEGSDIDSIYREEREAEVRALCDPRVRATIESEQIVLRSFAGVPHSSGR
jgi:predicted glycoside hydrolase/deacetylase ChbG (UPF0249 family)